MCNKLYTIQFPDLKTDDVLFAIADIEVAGGFTADDAVRSGLLFTEPGDGGFNTVKMVAVNVTQDVNITVVRNGINITVKGKFEGDRVWHPIHRPHIA